jgi:hypothetical protein
MTANITLNVPEEFIEKTIVQSRKDNLLIEGTLDGDMKDWVKLEGASLYMDFYSQEQMLDLYLLFAIRVTHGNKTRTTKKVKGGIEVAFKSLAPPTESQ